MEKVVGLDILEEHVDILLGLGLLQRLSHDHAQAVHPDGSLKRITE